MKITRRNFHSPVSSVSSCIFHGCNKLFRCRMLCSLLAVRCSVVWRQWLVHRRWCCRSFNLNNMKTGAHFPSSINSVHNAQTSATHTVGESDVRHGKLKFVWRTLIVKHRQRLHEHQVSFLRFREFIGNTQDARFRVCVRWGDGPKLALFINYHYVNEKNSNECKYKQKYTWITAEIVANATAESF